MMNCNVAFEKQNLLWVSHYFVCLQETHFIVLLRRFYRIASLSQEARHHGYLLEYCAHKIQIEGHIQCYRIWCAFDATLTRSSRQLYAIGEKRKTLVLQIKLRNSWIPADGPLQIRRHLFLLTVLQRCISRRIFFKHFRYRECLLAEYHVKRMSIDAADTCLQTKCLTNALLSLVSTVVIERLQ